MPPVPLGWYLWKMLSFLSYKFDSQTNSSVKSLVNRSKVISTGQGCLPSEVIVYQRLSSIKGHPLSMVAFYQRSSSVKDWLSSKVSYIKGRLPSNVLFHQSSIRGHFPSLSSSRVAYFRYHRYWRYETGPRLRNRCGPNSLCHSGSFSMNVACFCIFALNHRRKSFHSFVISALINLIRFYAYKVTGQKPSFM